MILDNNSNKKRKAFFLVNGVLDSYKAYTQNFLKFIEVAEDLKYDITISGFIKVSPEFLNTHAIKKLIIFKKNSLGTILLLFRTVMELLLHKYDVVIFGSLYTPFFPVYYLAMKLRRPNVVAYYMQDPVPESFKLSKNNKILQKIIYRWQIVSERVICPLCTYILMPSKTVNKIVRSRVPLDDVRTLFAYNTQGICKMRNLSLPKESNLQNIKNKYNIKGSPILLYSGKLQPNIRGLEQQLRVFKQLLKFKPTAQFVIAGGGSIQYFKKIVDKLNINDYVLFSDVVPTEELNIIYRISDIIVMPPIDFLLPSKFLEAIYTGVIPIVYCKSYDMVELLGDSAIIYDGTDKSLLEKLTEVIKNNKEHKRKVASIKWKVLHLEEQTTRSFYKVLCN